MVASTAMVRGVAMPVKSVVRFWFVAPHPASGHFIPVPLVWLSALELIQ